MFVCVFSGLSMSISFCWAWPSMHAGYYNSGVVQTGRYAVVVCLCVYM